MTLCTGVYGELPFCVLSGLPSTHAPLPPPHFQKVGYAPEGVTPVNLISKPKSEAPYRIQSIYFLMKKHKWHKSHILWVLKFPNNVKHKNLSPLSAYIKINILDIWLIALDYVTNTVTGSPQIIARVFSLNFWWGGSQNFSSPSDGGGPCEKIWLKRKVPT